MRRVRSVARVKSRAEDLVQTRSRGSRTTNAVLAWISASRISCPCTRFDCDLMLTQDGCGRTLLVTWTCDFLRTSFAMDLRPGRELLMSTAPHAPNPSFSWTYGWHGRGFSMLWT